ncbi:MAG: AraC family transcriptional regulator, partial [Bacteroidota bacterium]
MPDFNAEADPFFNRLNAVIEAHIGDEAFGVAELAQEMNMSRSTLLRRVKSGTGLSAALYIRKLRLKRAKEMLQGSALTVSEIAYKVGFSSSSYFTKCFREEYGYTPSEEGKQAEEHKDERSPKAEDLSPNQFAKKWLWVGAAAV